MAAAYINSEPGGDTPPGSGSDALARQFATTSDGYRIAYVAAGRGADVVLLHGSVTTLEDMVAGPFAGLSRAFHTVAIDRPGHGASTRPRFDGSLHTQARLVRDAIRQLGLSRPILVAHSMGGAVALTLATRFPEAVGGIVALAPFVFPEPRYELALFGPRSLPGIGPALAATTGRVADAAMLPLLWNAMFAPQAMPDAFLTRLPFARFAGTDEGVSTGEDMIAAQADLLQNTLFYPRCATPVRILAGDADLVVNNRLHGGMLARMMPGATFEAVPGMGHMLHHFMVERIVELVRGLVHPA